MTVEVQNAGTTVNLKFIGSISETSKFPEIKVENISEISFDFGDVDYINSAGVRVWIKWMWQFEKEKTKLGFTIRRCSSRIARQIRAIDSFVPKTTTIKSFMSPYECPSCSHCLEKLFNVEPDFRLKLESLAAALNDRVLCPKCGAAMELDVAPEDFFSLIKART